jgi:acetyl esterase/lipase
LFFGDSAGGQLAAFAALNIPYNNYDYEAPVGVIDFYGVSDFSKIVGGTNPDLNAPRFLFIHGTKDTVVPILQSRILYDQLTKVGIDAEYITVQGAGHGFNGPELPNVEYKKIVDNIDAFLKETIGK